jgi:hypothetical protein
MATTLQRVHPSYQREGTSVSTQWIGIFIMYYYLSILLNNFPPPHQFSCSRTLSPTLMLFSTSNCILSQGELGLVCNVSNIFCGGRKFIIFHYFVNSLTNLVFPKLITPHLTEYAYLHLKPSLCAS